MSDRICAVPDCSRGVLARGWCRAHYARWQTTGDVRADVPLRGFQPSSCVVPGCEVAPIARGYCPMHYRRWEVHCNPLITKRDAEFWPRFWARVDRTQDCWVWTGSTHPWGYGVVSVNGRQTRVHRFIWERFNGRAIPDGMLICHHCDNPPCINPSHLFLGTPKGNMADMWAKGRGRSPFVNT